MRRLAEQYAQEQKAHIEWASTLAEHVGKLTTNYKALTDDLTELFRWSTSRLSRSGQTETDGTAWRGELRVFSKAARAADGRHRPVVLTPASALPHESSSMNQPLLQDFRFGCDTFTRPTQSARLDFRVFCTRNPARMGGTLAAGQERPALDDG